MEGGAGVSAGILAALRSSPKGLTIADISRKANLNRNLVAKQLGVMLAKGKVDLRKVGSARVYSVAQRVPLSAMLTLRDDLVVILDHSGSIIQVNDAYLEFSGKERDEVLGLNSGESGLPLAGDPEIAAVIREDGTGEGLVREYPGPVAGRPRYFRVRVIPTVFEEGQPGYTIVGEDITADKESERRIAESEARYRAVVDTDHDLICRFRPDFSVTFMNRSFREYFGACIGPVDRADFLDTVSAEDRDDVRSFVGSLDHSGSPATHEHRVTGSPGSGGPVRWHSWNFSPVYDDAGIIAEIQANGRDITRERELEAKEEEHIAHMEFLLQAAMELVDMGEDEDIHRYIAEKLFGLLQCCFVAVTRFDMAEGTTTIRSIASGRENLDLIRQLGINPVGMTFPLVRDLTAEQIASRKRLVEGPTLYNLLFRMVPEDVVAAIEARMNLGSIYVMGIVYRGTIIGTVIIGIRKGRSLDWRETIEAFVGQAAVALMRQMRQ